MHVYVEYIYECLGRGGLLFRPGPGRQARHAPARPRGLARVRGRVNEYEWAGGCLGGCLGSWHVFVGGWAFGCLGGWNVFVGG